MPGGGLTMKAVESYTRAVNRIGESAKSALGGRLAALDWSDVASAREQAVSMVTEVLATATDAAAQVSATFYDGVRESQVGSRLGAQALSGYDRAATDSAIRAFAQLAVDGRPEMIAPRVLERVDYEVKRSAGESMYRNGRMDSMEPKFARVPTGSETCPFCIMLASRGFVYDKQGANAHYHSGCDCRVVPSFIGRAARLVGYDPDRYYEQFRQLEDEGKINRQALERSASRSRSSEWSATGPDGQRFESFADVQGYIYAATDRADLERRYAALGNVYGMNSDRMRSSRLTAAFRHMQKRLDN